MKLAVDREKLVTEMVSRVAVNPASAYRALLHEVCADAFDRLLSPCIETDVRIEAKKKADLEAIKVFQTNLDHLLLAPPAGQRCTLGVDPGIRTGCKLAIINRLGQFMETATIYPLEPKRDLEGSRAILEQLATRFPIEAVAIGNGTGGREAEAFIRGWLKDTGREDVLCVAVSEAGASVYSASDVAREEFPEQDVTVRGAISIARRLPGPAGRAGEGRAQVHRRRPVPARREPDRPQEEPGRGGGVLREPGGGGPELGQLPAAGLRGGHRREPGQAHRPAPLRQRRLQAPGAAPGSAPLRREGLPAGGGLPAHPGGREPPGRQRRAPGKLSGGAAHLPGGGQDRARAGGQRRGAGRAWIRPCSSTSGSAWRRSRTSSPS